jgi:hypothetical protein
LARRRDGRIEEESAIEELKALGSSSNASQQPTEASEATDHEVLRVIAQHGLPLCQTLRDMLNEHFSHRTERRGGGFTQSTRHLATYVNRAWRKQEIADVRVFDARLKQPPPRAELEPLLGKLEREESKLLVNIMLDIVCPVEEPSADSPTQLKIWPEDDLKIGTCSLAEKYFLELASAFVRGKGQVNVLVSDQDEPILVEKMNLGDNHSCISVAPVVLNGIRLPPGSLFGVRYDEPIGLRRNRSAPGHVIPIRACSGFRFLRLSTLAVAPQHRARAFTAHFQAQLDAGLFAPREATVEQLRKLALDQL